MKFIIALLLSALLAFAESLFFSWWSIAVACLLVAVFIHQKPWKAFLSAFLGLFLLWGILALIIDINNEHLLSAKIASLLPLGGSSILLVLVTALVGGLVGGFAGLTGSYLRKAIIT